MTAPHLGYLHLDAASKPASRGQTPLPAEVMAVLRLTTPKGAVREAHLSREQLARLIEAAGAIIRRSPIGERADGYVWCEQECGAHQDTADPFGYGEPCPGPHRPLYLDPEEASP